MAEDTISPDNPPPEVVPPEVVPPEVVPPEVVPPEVVPPEVVPPEVVPPEVVPPEVVPPEILPPEVVPPDVVPPEILPPDNSIMPTPPDTDPSEDLNAVSSAGELVSWFAAHVQTGGTVRLTADIEWSRTHRLVRPSAPVTILTGAHTIRIQSGAQWQVRSAVDVQGSGTVFYVENGGVLSLFSENTVHADGDGAIAVLTEHAAGIVSDFSRISAQGDGAVGIRSLAGLTLSTLSVSASGANASAVLCEGFADLTYCRVTAEGEGAQAIAAADILLDACYAAPEPENAVLLSRTVSSIVFPPLYADAGGGMYQSNLKFVFCQLLSDTRPPLAVRMPTSLDVRGVSTAVEAQFDIPVIFAPPYPEIDVSLPLHETIPLYVLDPVRPRLISAALQNDTLRLNLYKPIPGGASVQVYISVDEGATWDLLLTASGTFTSHISTPIQPEPTYSALFYLEMLQDNEVKRSNLLRVSISEEGTLLSPPGNGDYDGGDMEDDSPPSPPFDVPEHPKEDHSPSPPISGIPPEAFFRRVPLIPLRPAETAGQSDISPDAAVTCTPCPLTPPKPPPARPHAASAAVPPVSLPTAAASGTPVPDASTAPDPGRIEAPQDKYAALPPAAGAQPQARQYPPAFYLTALACLVLFCISVLAGVLLYRRRSRGVAKPLLILYCVAVVLSSVCFFLCKFQLDSKYASQPQASRGVLDASLMSPNQSLVFLWDGWEFYDSALTPQELHAGGQAASDIYIGQTGVFGGGAAPGGGATYRLTAVSASKPEYALEVPQIFGSFRLWINGVLRAGSGADMPEPYLLITPENDRIEIVISVTSHGQLYNGLVYPPAFGTPRMVWLLLQLRTVLTTAACGCAIFLAFLYLIIGLKARMSCRAFSFALLCLCYVGSVIRVPLLSLGFSADSLLIFCRICYYGIFAAIMLILTDIYQVKQAVRYASLLLGAAMCLWVFWFQLWGVQGNWQIFRIFSATVSLYKFIVAFFLAGLSVLAVHRSRRHSLPLLFGVLFFAAALLSDRLYSKYEPVLLHWPVETAALLQIGIIAYVLISDTVRVYGDNILLDKQQQTAQTLIAAQTAQYTTLSRHLDEFAHVRHDMRSLLITLQSRCRSGDYQGLDDLIGQSLGAATAPAFTGNSLVDAILSIHFDEAKEARVRIRSDFGVVPSKLNISDTDLCILLSNLVHNAIEAVSSLPADQARTIDLYLRYTTDDHMLKFSCKNPCYRKLYFVNDLPVSSKRSWGHGLGLKTTKELIQKYGGILLVEQQGAAFFSQFSIQC